MNKEAIFEMITNHVREVLPELEDHVFEWGERLVDLGANSVDRAEIVTMTLESLALKIPRVELHGVSNLGELAEVLSTKMKTA